MKALITALSALAVFLACLVVSSAEAQEPDKAAPTDYKVADVAELVNKLETPALRI